MKLRGVVFDLDGTLVSQELNFEAIRQEIGLGSGTPLLEALDTMAGSELQRARQILDRHEEAAAACAVLHAGAKECLEWLKAKGLKLGLLSRNSRRSVFTVLERCGLQLDKVVAREDAPFKPSPHGLWLIGNAWQVPPAEVLMVGDYLYDLQAGRSAGTRTALITHGKEWPFVHLADLTFPSFQELPDLLNGWLE
ncbi:MAG TPA: HAD family hydrolase [Gemmataceae bacterium]|jgi:HAD superfamily hydrolase (TIGR01549 family)|nr:HAD family hydrolase [Gemmataceae bacterium]